MRVTPKTEAEIQEANLLPEGRYDFEVTHAHEGVSKKGNEMITVELTIFTESGGRRKLTDYLMEAMAFKLRHFCEVTGIIDAYNAGGLDADNLHGLTGRVQLGKEEAKGNFKAKNTVLDYGEGKGDELPKPDNRSIAQKREPVNVPTKQELEDGDEIPF